MNTQNSLREKEYNTPKASTVFTQETCAKEAVYRLNSRILGIYPQQPPQPTNTTI
jgi:hypothetical protein